MQNWVKEGRESIDNLLDYHPVSQYTKGSTTYVILHHAVLSTWHGESQRDSHKHAKKCSWIFVEWRHTEQWIAESWLI